jgi:hypothetical protein
MSVLQPDSLVNLPSTSPHAHWFGWVSLTLATAALVLICMGDPFWLALPITLLAAVIGRRCLRLGHEQHAGALIGFTLGLFNLFFWFLLVVLFPLVTGMPTSTLFQIPAYN